MNWFQRLFLGPEVRRVLVRAVVDAAKRRAIEDIRSSESVDEFQQEIALAALDIFTDKIAQELK